MYPSSAFSTVARLSPCFGNEKTIFPNSLTAYAADYSFVLYDLRSWKNCAGRALLFFIEAAISQSISLHDNKDCGYVFFISESDRRLLDFNFGIATQVMRLANSVSIFANGCFVFGGVSQIVNVGLKVFLEAAPSFLENAPKLIEIDEVDDLVENPDDVPEFWFDDGEGKPYLATDRRNVWCYERCLSDDNRITTKDLYGPGPWPYEVVDYSALRPSGADESGPGALETIEEDGEEEGEW